MNIEAFITIAVLTASSAFVQEANPEEAALCGEGQFCSDDYGLQTHPAVSLLQRGAKRLLNAVQPPQPNVVSSSNDVSPVAVEHSSPSKTSEPTIAIHSRIRQALQLLQTVGGRCSNQRECKRESEIILFITCTLLLLIICIFTAFFFFREDKEEQVTPLCPQMVVRESSMVFKLSWALRAEKIDVCSAEDPSKVLAKVAMDWPDPFRPCASGIASTARLMNMAGMNMATVVARNCAVSGQALALCRHGCEIFGFVEPDTSMRYHVKHRTGVHLLTLVGDFANWNVDGVNPAGAVVFTAKKENGHIVGRVTQYVDAGLMICCVIAAEVHRALQQPPPLEGPLTFDFDQDNPFTPDPEEKKKQNMSPAGDEVEEAVEEQAGEEQDPSDTQEAKVLADAIQSSEELETSDKVAQATSNESHEY
jgi:hypothetical protein